MRKNIDTYFTTAQTVRSTERLVSHDDLHSIIANTPPATVQTAPPSAQLLSRITGSIIMKLGIIAATALGAWWYLAPTVQTAFEENAAQHQPEHTMSGSNQSQQQLTRQLIAQLRKQANATPAPTATPGFTPGAMPLYKVDDNTLAQMGVRKNGYFYTVDTYERLDNIPDKYKPMLAAKKYPTDKIPIIVKGTKTYTFRSCRGDMKDYDGSWNLYKDPKNGGYCVGLLVYGTESSVMSISDKSPCLPDSTARSAFVEEFAHLQDDINAMHGDDYFSMTELPTNKRNYRYLTAFVPITHVFSNGKDSAIAILFFVPEDFSERLNAISKKPESTVARTSAETKNTNTAVESVKDIAGIESLVLSESELLALGIERDRDKGIRYISESILDKNQNPIPSINIRKQVVTAADTAKRVASIRAEMAKKLQTLHEKGYDTTQTQILYRSVIDLGKPEPENITIMQYGGWGNGDISPAAPVGFSYLHFAYSYDHGTKSHSGITQYRLSNINEYSPLLLGKSKSVFVNKTGGEYVGTGLAIPVRIDMGTVELSKPNSLLAREGIDTSKYRRIVLQVWFVPTKEFVERLPVRYRQPLMKELNLYERVMKGELQPLQACNEIDAQQSYLGMCGMSSGSLKILSLQPNPATAQTSIIFASGKQGSATVGLYSSDGAFIRNVYVEKPYRQGTTTWEIDIQKLSPGMFIVMVVTSNGEKSSQRLLVQ